MLAEKAAERMLLAALALVTVYVGVILAGDARAWSGSDPGGKVATIDAMSEHGLGEPDVGYWAEEWDPQGRLHPLIKTQREGDAWIQPTPVLFAVVAVPLYSVAGIQGVLALSIAGAVGAAFGARSLARFLGASTGWPAFWLVGLGSVTLHYVGDPWEHLPALGLAMGGVGLLARQRIGIVEATTAGLLLGAAVTLRREMLLWVLALVIVSLLRAPLRRCWRLGSAAFFGGSLGLAVTAVAWWEVGRTQGAAHASRAGRQVAAVDRLEGRLEDAWLTGFSVHGGTAARGLLLSGCVLAGLGLLGWAASRLHRGERASRALCVGTVLASIGYFGRLVSGLGFVPGVVPAQPMSVGAMGARGGCETSIVLAAVLPFPLVWVTQWQGGMDIQWGGRYLMLGGVLLVTVGAVAVGRHGWKRPAAVMLIAFTVLTSAVSVMFHVERSRVMARVGEELLELADDQPVLSTLPLGREVVGVVGDDLAWLEAREGADLDLAVNVARRAGAEELVVVSRSALPAVDGTEAVAWHRVSYFRDDALHVVRLQLQ